MERLWRYRGRIALGAIVVAIALTVLVLTVPEVAGIAGAVVGWVSGLVLVVAAQWENIQLWGGRALSSMGWLHGSIDRLSTASQVEGLINGARYELQDELPGVMNETVRVKFVKNSEEASRLENGQIVVAMKRSSDSAENLARATLSYVSSATIRPARPYVDPALLRSVDFSVTKRVLSGTDAKALDYLLTTLWPPALEREPRLRVLCHVTETLEQDGVLTRILLSELLELGRRLYGQFPPPSLHEETRDFAAFLYRIVARQPGEELDLSYRSAHVRVGVVLVGEKLRAEQLGAVPYVRACLTHLRLGAGAVYMLSRGARRPILMRAVEQLKSHGRLLDAGVTDYRVRRNGTFVDATCARLLFDLSTAKALGTTTSGRPSWRRGTRRQRASRPRAAGTSNGRT